MSLFQGERDAHEFVHLYRAGPRARRVAFASPTDDGPLTITDPDAYVHGVLSRIGAELAATTEGGRNHALNKAAFEIGRLLHAEPPLPIDEQVALSVLLAACDDNGYNDEHTDAERTALRGFVDGGKSPREWTQATVHDKPPPFRPGGLVPDQRQPLDTYATAVAAEKAKEKARRQARRELDREERDKSGPMPALVSLSTFLETPDEDAVYRVDRLLPVGGRVMLAAQHKAGKTAMRDNLVRSLADGVPFLDEYPVTPLGGTVVVIDDELDERMLRRWLRDTGIENTDSVIVLSLRGRLSSFDIVDPDVRKAWADELARHGAAFVVLDCLRPVLDGLGLSEDKEAGTFLVAFDALLEESGAREGMVVHHMGHSGERSRGSTRLRDWPDVEWFIVREKGDGGEDDLAGPRYFRAYGRDVNVPESLLGFDPATRRQWLIQGGRKEVAENKLVDAVVRVLGERPGLGKNELIDALADEGGRSSARRGINKAIESGLVRVELGANKRQQHYLTTGGPGDPDHRADPDHHRGVSGAPTYGRRTTTTAPARVSTFGSPKAAHP